MILLLVLLGACGDNGAQITNSERSAKGEGDKANMSSFITIELNGRKDWAKPGLEPRQPARLRIPSAYLSRQALDEAKDGTLIATNIELGVPVSESGFSSSTQRELSGDVLILQLAETAGGWGARRADSIRYAIEHNGVDDDPAVGLKKVMIDDSPGYSKRYRYFIDGERRDLEYVHLDCVYFQSAENADTCLMEIMPRPNVALSMHLAAEQIPQWRERVSDLRRLAARW